ncbi:hypothetical protein B296_00041316 [Ensete ventricosum]|uniref:Uncharacterized protein n=1 Tax=Ensete ventricosum TaxID=4639 RepID=A0A426Z1W5_ENSVE|nr:hypothetical protein B296_00041316 [Ensete ventricosum]
MKDVPLRIWPLCWHVRRRAYMALPLLHRNNALNPAPPNLSDEESILVRRLKGILSTSRAIRNLIEEWLVEANLSPASRGMP